MILEVVNGTLVDLGGSQVGSSFIVNGYRGVQTAVPSELLNENDTMLLRAELLLLLADGRAIGGRTKKDRDTIREDRASREADSLRAVSRCNE